MSSVSETHARTMQLCGSRVSRGAVHDTAHLSETHLVSRPLAVAYCELQLKLSNTRRVGKRGGVEAAPTGTGVSGQGEGEEGGRGGRKGCSERISADAAVATTRTRRKQS
jgi:hypothetical protein